jgi:hypothetical protein
MRRLPIRCFSMELIFGALLEADVHIPHIENLAHLNDALSHAN